MITNTTRKFWGFVGSIFYMLWRKKRYRKWLFVPTLMLIAGFLLPQNMIIPVKGATTKDWNKNSFWAYPWGSSITHKGIDIFKPTGTPIIASTYGIVVYTSQSGKGGNAVMMLGPKWRFHYYAHLAEFKTHTFQLVDRGTTIGTVGDTGNAKGKPPHLHYAITSPFPYLHLFDNEAVHGWKKMFYLNPDTWLRN